MKKIVSYILLICLILSTMMLSGCGSSSSVVEEAKPGTYKLETKTYSRYLVNYCRAYMAGAKYIPKIDSVGNNAYCYETVGFILNTLPKYIYEVHFTDVQVGIQVTCAYDTYISSTSYKQVLCETVYLVLDLDDSGKIANAQLGTLDEKNKVVLVDENAKNNSNDFVSIKFDSKEQYLYVTYLDTKDENNIFCPYASNPQIISYSVINASGTVTYPPRNEADYLY